MILDNNLTIDASVVKSTGTYYTDAVDLVGAGAVDTHGNTLARNVGQGEFSVYGVVTEALTSSGGGTLAIDIGFASDAAGSDFTSAKGYTAAPVAGYTKGKELFNFRLPDEPPYRYLIIKYIIGTAATTAGRVKAGLVRDLQSN